MKKVDYNYTICIIAMDCWGAAFDVEDWDINTQSSYSEDIDELTNKFKNIETLKKEWVINERKKNRDAWVDKRIKEIIKDAKKRYKQKQKRRSKKCIINTM